MIIHTDGIIIRMECSSISVQGRVTSGVKLINLHENSIIASIAKVRESNAIKNENQILEQLEAELMEENNTDSQSE